MNPRTQSPDPLLSSAQTAAYLGGISTMTLWRWVRDGVIPAPIKIRNRNYWRQSGLDAAVESAAQKSSTAA
jgi:predicted DNA-binding transcriptional regulator AlpA